MYHDTGCTLGQHPSRGRVIIRSALTNCPGAFTKNSFRQAQLELRVMTPRQQNQTAKQNIAQKSSSQPQMRAPMPQTQVRSDIIRNIRPGSSNGTQRSKGGCRDTSGKEDNIARLEAENRQLRGRWPTTTPCMPSNADRCCRCVSPSTPRGDPGSGTTKGPARHFPTYRTTFRSS